jgi:CheY-like chemotaxis protein
MVEDEAALAKQLAAALGDAGYAVDCAADGERADFLGSLAIVRDLAECMAAQSRSGARRPAS